MNLLGRYIIRAIIGPFLFGAVTIVFLFLFQFLFNNLNKFLGKGLSYWIILQLIGYNISWMLILAVPIGILFGTVMAFGQLSASHEITVMKAGGVSLIKMMYPVIFMGVILTYLLFLFNDKILPYTNHKAKVLLSDVTRKKPTFSIEKGQFTTAIEGYNILARDLDSLTGILKGVTIYDDTRGARINIASADTGIISFTTDYSKMIVTLINGEVHQNVPTSVRDYRKVNFKKYQLLINAQGFAFERSSDGVISKGDREMTIAEMQAIVNESYKHAWDSKKKYETELKKHINFLLKGESDPGYNELVSKTSLNYPQALIQAEKRINFFNSTVSTDISQYNDYVQRAESYEVEIYKKYAIPFACLLFVFIGCPLGIITKGGSFGVSAGISLVFYIIYWICLIGGEKLADRGLITPFLSMWSGNILIGIFGIVLMLRVNNESFRLFTKKLVRT